MKKILKIQCQIIFDEESDFSEEKTSDKEDFRPTILQPFQFEPEKKNCVVMRAMRKKLNIFTLQLSIYYKLKQEISIGTNVDIASREVNAMPIASTKIPEREGSILSSSFYGQLPDY